MEMIPKLARIERVEKEAPDIKSIYFSCSEPLTKPIAGQFFLISVFGCGEAPFGAILEGELYSITFRKVGRLTSKLFQLEPGLVIGVRGPYGRGFEPSKFFGRDILLIAGGIGIPPIKQALLDIVANRDNFGEVYLLYGARSEDQLIYRREYEKWEKEGVEILLTIDEPSSSWKGRTGFVTELINELPRKQFVCFICGPPIMMKFACKKLVELGISKNEIFVALERLVQCGIGICGRCAINGYYLCKHGPVFKLSELEKSLEVVW